MHVFRPTLISAALLSCALFISAGSAAAKPELAGGNSTPGPSGKSAEPQLPLRLRAELDVWLKTQAGKPTPFDALSAGARERVLTMLRFYEEGGLGSLPGDELSWEMTRPQAIAWLKLFGREEWIDSIELHPVATRWKGDARKPSTMDSRIAAFTKDLQSTFDHNDFQYERKVSALYRRHFPKPLIDSADELPDPDLLLLARTSASVTSFTSGEPALEDLMEMLSLLQSRGDLDISPLATRAQRALMSLGQLDQAHRLTAQYPSVKFDQIPAVSVAPAQFPPGPKWWRLAPDGRSLTAESADLSGTKIFVLAGCHFSISAAEDIQTDPELGPAFAAHAHWLGQPLGSERVEDWKAWNDQFPTTPMRLVTLRREWPMFPSWNMPTYVVVRDGKAIDQTSGSFRNAPENRTALVRMLRRHGLMPPAGKKAASISPPHATGAN